MQHLAGAADELAGDQERQQHVGDPGELAGPHDQVVLVAAVGVARRVGVVLEQVDVAADALVAQPLLGVDQQVFEHAFARAVMGDQLHQAVALGGGVLGVAAHVQVQPRAVTQENVGAAAPRDDPSEQVAGHFVGRETAMTVESAGDTEFVSMPMIRRCTIRAYLLKAELVWSPRRWVVSAPMSPATKPSDKFAGCTHAGPANGGCAPM